MSKKSTGEETATKGSPRVELGFLSSFGDLNRCLMRREMERNDGGLGNRKMDDSRGSNMQGEMIVGREEKGKKTKCGIVEEGHQKGKNKSKN